MQPLRILHVTPYSADAWAYGGIPRLASTLARGLARRGHQVTICTTDACDAFTRLHDGDGVGRRRAWPEQRTADNVELRVFPNLSNRLAYHLQLFLPVGLDEFLRRRARLFDVAHLHACRNVPGVIAARRLSAAGVPYVLAPNGTAPLIERRQLAKRVFDAAFGSRVLHGAARLHAVSEAERTQLHTLGVPDAAIRVVPNPIDLDEFTTPVGEGAFRRRFSLPPRAAAPLVLFLGKLTPRKRVDRLVRAFAALDRPNARLVIAGNDMGAGRSVRALVASLGLEERTTFTGLLRGRDRLDALADADVVVYPSEQEIFGLVPLEALMVQTPVVVADDCGCGEVVRAVANGLGGAVAVPAGDPSALAAGIDRTLACPRESREGAAAAAARVRSAFGDDVVAAAMERLYEDVVASRG
jgi:glycosyltransferase involved in cell wall biosynthesis